MTLIRNVGLATLWLVVSTSPLWSFGASEISYDHALAFDPCWLLFVSAPLAGAIPLLMKLPLWAKLAFIFAAPLLWATAWFAAASLAFHLHGFHGVQ